MVFKNNKWLVLLILLLILAIILIFLFKIQNKLINKSLPNLIVIDGGKGQLSSSVKSLKELGIDKKVTIIGILIKIKANNI